MIFQDFWLSNISKENPHLEMPVFDADMMVFAGRQPLAGSEKFLQDLRKTHISFCFLPHGSSSRIEKTLPQSILQVTVYARKVFSCTSNGII